MNNSRLLLRKLLLCFIFVVYLCDILCGK